MAQTIDTLIRRGLSDHRVTASEVKGLVAQARQDSKTARAPEKDLEALRQVAARHRDEFTPAAARDLKDFLGAQPPVGRDEPALMEEADPSVRYQPPAKGTQLFVDGVDVNDFTQGWPVGDCYFLASAVAVAKNDPQAIRDMIKDNGDGTFTFDLFAKGKDGSAKPTSVTVDGWLPRSQREDGDTFTSSSNAKELWGPLLEKAYAKLRGGYDVIGEGGEGRDALFALTGRPTDHVARVGKADPDALFGKLVAGQAQRKPMTTGTFDSDPNAGTKLAYGKLGLQSGHEYTLLGVEQVDGKRYVTVRDPFGGDLETGGKYMTATGVMRLPYETYLRCFEELDVLK